MKWEDITLQQFQEVYRLSLSTDLDEMEKVGRIICILYDKTETQVDDMTMAEFNKLANQCSFLLIDQIPGKPQRKVHANGKKYGIIYNPRLLRHRQYVEILHFAETPIENMHYIMASIVQPIRWGMRKKNEVSMHEEISNDMLNARLIDVYQTCLFFCKLFRNSMLGIKGYLVQEMMKKGMNEYQAAMLLNDSLSAMDGFIPPGKLQNLSA